MTRRLALFTLTAASYSRIMGANERLQVGFIGCGRIGGQHVSTFKNQIDVEIAAFSDVYQSRLEQAVAACGGRARAYPDFRKLLDDKHLQAVVISTPEHWHALMTIMACAAGKDVYIEKPLTLFVKEGRWMVDAARRHNRVVQVGTQQRSGTHYQHARELLQSGYIGPIISARAASFRNVMPGFGSPANSAEQSELEYDMWLGPAPKRPFNKQRGPDHLRWFWDYSGGQMTNLGAQEIDMMMWVMGVKSPLAVSSTGGRHAPTSLGDTLDTQDAFFEFPKCTSIYSFREARAGRGAGTGLEFFGTRGSLTVSRSGFAVFPDSKLNSTDAIPVSKGQTPGGPVREEVKPKLYVEAKRESGSSRQQFDSHVRNFLDCVKSRERPIADVEGGHQVTTACHLANLSLRVGRKLAWDPEREQIMGDPETNAMLERPYRKPWDSVLRGLIA